jgi:hypothetical protein
VQTIVDRSSYEDSKNSESFVLSISEDSFDIHSSVED